MSDNSGRAIVILVIVLFIITAVAAAMYYPPAKDFLSAYIPGIYQTTDNADDNIVSAPVKPAVPDNAPDIASGQTQGPTDQTAGQATPPDQSNANTVPATGQTANAPQSSGGILPITGLLQNPFGNAAAPQSAVSNANKPITADTSDNSPGSVVKSCMSKLQNRDIIGAEQYVSDNGRKMSLSGMTGIHKILMKNMIDNHSFDEIGYNDAKIHGQTAWVPIYSKLDARNKIISLYILCANRGDGWKVDDLYDPR